jgi:DNA-directed RNA polymerase subunit beta'
MFELSNFNAIKIGISSPEKIREWSYGEVTKAETINYRTQKPERDGLFCERIFGPRKSYECACGKYKRIRYKGVVCDKCGVEVTDSSVRRERMGHIELATPVSHIWFFKINPSKIGLALDMKTASLEQVLYYVNYVVLDKGTSNFEKMQVITDSEYRKALEEFGPDSFKVGMGGEAIKQLLKQIDLKKEVTALKEELAEARETKKLKLSKRIRILESFENNNARPEWMIMDVIPVLPPDLRPMVQLDGGRFATNDLNDLYRRVINRNLRLKKLMSLGAPEVIVRNEKRMLQEAVDALFDNGKRGKAVTGGAKNRELKSIAASLKGKQGRFRQNLLGKRVDYSGRAVIVVGPELKMYQCGLPKQMALELFKPFIMNRLVEMNASYNIKSARRMVEREKPIVWDILDEVIKDHPVLLNRAPTLHKLGIQAFEVVLVEGNAIRLHPLVCAGFNADFDGDQMAVHVPLSIEARAEARFLMLASNNIVKPSDGKPIATPQQDIVLGTYYLTMVKPEAKGTGRMFISEEEALMAYDQKEIELQSEIYIRRVGEFEGKPISERVKTTMGRIIFNREIPQDLEFVDRTKRENALIYEVNFAVGKGELSKIVSAIYNMHGTTKTAKILDAIKALGYKYSTIGALTINVFDMEIPEKRAVVIEETQALVDQNEKLYRRGLITLDEKMERNILLWGQATSRVEKAVKENLDPFNPLNIMATSKARTNPSQLNQVCGMRGIMAIAGSAKIDIPVTSNYRLGLTPLDYFISARGGRKGLADKALKTAEAGYLTRRLVDIAQEITITSKDCFEEANQKVKGMSVGAVVVDDTPIVGLAARIVGRVAVADVICPNTGEVLAKANELISEKAARKIENSGLKEVEIRTALTCRAKGGVCSKCYGKDMSTNHLASLGEAVGIIAAQAIGEPGTQLTMNTFHTGGVASGGIDITSGFPRVQELFEARNPKGAATISEVAGEVSAINTVGKQKQVVIKTDRGEVSYTLNYSSVLIVEVGDKVKPGTPLTKGPMNPKDLIRTQGLKSVQNYIINEILGVYAKQAVDLNVKHLEIIIRQMLDKVEILDAGDTDFLPGSLVSVATYEEANEKALMDGKVPATVRRVLLGLTKASLNTESFLSAASFQETARILTEAAVENKLDPLKGLKENIIIGKLIPAGTGIKKYRDIMPKQLVKDYNPYEAQPSKLTDVDDADGIIDFA